MALALKSQCVLLKYDSPKHLFYFDQLVPWHHYVPIRSDDEVDSVIEIEKREPGHFSAIAENSQQFYNDILSRESCFDYMSGLLRRYADLLTRGKLRGFKGKL